MTNITIIGTGNMGKAIAAVAVKGGAAVQLLGRDAAKAHEAAEAVGATAGVIGDAIVGDIVVLAVPHVALADLVLEHSDQFAGKVLVDITNPVDFATFDRLTVPVGSSAAAELATAVPSAKVVKAFNTNLATTLATGVVGVADTTVLVAGDDVDAKDALIGVIAAGGIDAIDVGAIARARELESVGFLQLTLAVGGKISWAGGVSVAQ